MGILAHVEQLQRGPRLLKNIELVFVELVGGVHFPEFGPGGMAGIAFHAKILAFGKGVADEHPILPAHHAFVRLIDVPVVLGKNVIADDGLRVLEDRREADALDALVFLGAGKLENSRADVDAADERVRLGGGDGAGAGDEERRADAAVIQARFAARKRPAIVGQINDVRIPLDALPLQLGAQLAHVIIRAAHLVHVLGEILARHGSIIEIRRHLDVLRLVLRRLVVDGPAAVGVAGSEPEKEGLILRPLTQHRHPVGRLARSLAAGHLVEPAVHRLAHVMFARERRVIPRRPQRLRKHRLIRRHRGVQLRRAGVVRIPPGDDAAPARRTTADAQIRPMKQHPLPRHPVEMRRLRHLAAVTAQVIPRNVVGDEQNEIGLLGLGNGCQRKGGKENEKPFHCVVKWTLASHVLIE